MLICGENTNPLARYALMAQGEQVHVSSYPPVWPTRPSNQPGRYDLAAAIRIRAGAHSFEGKVFNIVSSALLDKSSLDALQGLGREARDTLEQSPQAVSMFIGPSGEVISDTLCESEGLLYQDIDISQCVEPKQFHDVVGYYNRFDIFDLTVTRKRLSPIQFLDVTAASADNSPKAAIEAELREINRGVGACVDRWRWADRACARGRPRGGLRCNAAGGNSAGFRAGPIQKIMSANACLAAR